MTQFLRSHYQVRPFRASFNEIPADALIGVGRESAEHWVHSNPTVAPCDVYSGPFKWGYDFEKKESEGTWAPSLHIGSRFPLEAYRRDLPISWHNWVAWRCLEWRDLYGR